MKGIYLEPELISSPAFMSLSKWGLQVYLRFLTKREIVTVKHKKKASTRQIVNNGKIVFCYSTAEKLGIGRREFRNSLDELIDKGLIDLNHQGAGGRAKDQSTFFISDRWKNWNTPNFKPTPTPRIKNTKEGQGWAMVNARKKRLSVTNMSPKKPLLSVENATSKEKKKGFGVADTSLEKQYKIAASS